MKRDLLNVPTVDMEEQLSEIAEKVLNESLLEFRIEKLREEIDQSLQERNKDKFLQLSSELKKLLS